jgi:hypothetical protein
MFAIANSAERGGMLLGLLIAPVIVAATSPQFAVQAAAGALLLAAAVAAAGLLRTQTLEHPIHTAPMAIGVAARAFVLTDSNGHEHQATDLAASSPIVLVLLGNADATKIAMVTELGKTINPTHASILVVANPRSPSTHNLPTTPNLQLFQDRDGRAHATLGISATETSGRPSGGVIVLDQDLVVRFAFVPHEPGEWIPASFVLGRLTRLTPPGADAPARLAQTNLHRTQTASL